MSVLLKTAIDRKKFGTRFVSSVIVLLSACAAETEQATVEPRCIEQTTATPELIDRSSAIVLATALVNQPQQSPDEAIDLKEIQNEANKDRNDRIVAGQLPIQQFEAIEYLKGNDKETFFVVTAPQETDESSADSSNRVALTQDCKVSATFTAGETYLIFMGPPHIKSYEAVSDENDPWVQEVRRYLNKGR